MKTKNLAFNILTVIQLLVINFIGFGIGVWFVVKVYIGDNWIDAVNQGFVTIGVVSFGQAFPQMAVLISMINVVIGFIKPNKI